jgi:hypothetical protein
LLPSGIGSEKDRKTKTGYGEAYEMDPKIADAELDVIDAFFASEFCEVYDCITLHIESSATIQRDSC